MLNLVNERKRIEVNMLEGKTTTAKRQEKYEERKECIYVAITVGMTRFSKRIRSEYYTLTGFEGLHSRI
jgi:hypothetical protein